MEVIILPDAAAVGLAAANVIAKQLRNNPRSVLGLATGSSPIPLYAELVRMHREEGLDFSKATSFNLDEYVGLAPDHPQSYRHFMQVNLFDHVNIPPAHTHVPDGMAEDIPAACAAYEKGIAKAGGIDVQVLGIGANGHIGFNEPSSSLRSRTRFKTLTEKTCRDNARFFDSVNEVPRYCVTMGIGTILESRQCLMIATGGNKADAVAAMVEGPLSAMCPASALQLHTAAKVFVDEAAAAKLTYTSYYRWVHNSRPDWQRD